MTSVGYISEVSEEQFSCISKQRLLIFFKSLSTRAFLKFINIATSLQNYTYLRLQAAAFINLPFTFYLTSLSRVLSHYNQIMSAYIRPSLDEKKLKQFLY